LDDDEQKDENTKHLVLESLLSVDAIEKGKAEDHRAANGKDRFRIDVRRSPPVLLRASVGYEPELGCEGCCESLVAFLCMARHSLLYDRLPQPRKLCTNGVVFGARSPSGRPVDTCMRAWCRSNHLEHVFRGISTWLTWWASVANEVVHECLRSRTNVTEVNRLPPLSQK
jgi:hypothetical protein